MKKSIVLFSAVNLFGMIWLLRFVLSARQLAVMEERVDYDFGDSINFLGTVVPVLLVCLIVNIVWSVMAAVAIYRRRGYRSATAWLIVIALWTAMFQVDRKLAELPSPPATSTANSLTQQPAS